MYDNVKFTSHRIHAELQGIVQIQTSGNFLPWMGGLEVFLERGPAQFEAVVCCTEHLVIYKSARHGSENSDLFMIDII